ncbi:MAG TPA: hypothetical protein VHU23_01680 [Rhizomicrobium sp.]|nr:hypothetical protein [Rhizomicrobium sp.]
MARGWWTRWGRGDCVGYGLDIGRGSFSFRAGVSRNVRTPARAELTWCADLYGRVIADEIPDPETAMAKVEEELQRSMRDIWADWAGYEAWRKAAGSVRT